MVSYNSYRAIADTSEYSSEGGSLPLPNHRIEMHYPPEPLYKLTGQGKFDHTTSYSGENYSSRYETDLEQDTAPLQSSINTLSKAGSLDGMTQGLLESTANLRPSLTPAALADVQSSSTTLTTPKISTMASSSRDTSIPVADKHYSAPSISDTILTSALVPQGLAASYDIPIHIVHAYPSAEALRIQNKIEDVDNSSEAAIALREQPDFLPNGHGNMVKWRQEKVICDYMSDITKLARCCMWCELLFGCTTHVCIRCHTQAEILSAYHYFIFKRDIFPEGDTVEIMLKALKAPVITRPMPFWIYEWSSEILVRACLSHHHIFSQH